MLIAAPAGAARAAMRQRFLEHDVPSLLERSPLVRKFTVNIADIEAKVPDRKPPAYDVAVELWFETVGGMVDTIARRSGPAARIGTTHLYHVRERVQLDDGWAPIPGKRSPGVKATYLSRRVEGMSPEEARRR